MYFCYIDESGDTGPFDPENIANTGSPYFVLTGLVVHAGNWKLSLDVLKSFRKRLAAQAFLPYDVEFHCAEMIDPRKVKAYQQISIPDRWKLIREFANTIGQQQAFSIIAIVINKNTSRLSPADYLTASVTKLYQAYDEFLRMHGENGIVLFDRANEKVITTHVRRLMGTGSSGQTIPNIRIGWVIEDPIFRVSADSFFVQAADLTAYTLKEKEFPITARRKFNADRIFANTLSVICFHSTFAGEDGIIRV